MNTEQTAMQAMIAFLEKEGAYLNGPNDCTEDKQTGQYIQLVILREAIKLLAKEREQIEKAFKDPYKKGRVHPGNNMNKDFEFYLRQNHNQ